MSATTSSAAAASRTAQDDPFSGPWTTPFEAPPFEAIRPEHIRPAFDRALAEQEAQMAALASDPAAPTFETMIAPLERSGALLRRVSAVFFNLAGAHTSPEIQAIEREMAPRLARHRNAIFMNEALFRRVDDLHRRAGTLALNSEQTRLIERTRTRFVRAGVEAEPEARTRLSAITERLAELGTRFSQNVLADETGYTLSLDNEADFAGLPDFAKAAARRAAEERGLPGGVVTLSRSSIEPFLTFSERRDLREIAYRAWLARGDGGGATDNKAVAAEIAALRAERAVLLGYETFAHYKLDDAMARTPEAVRGLLDAVWAPARARVGLERDDLQALAQSEGGDLTLEPWDWRYYAEKMRQARFSLDEAEIKPYLRLDRVIEAAFHVAGRLFGLRFAERTDVPVYHPDVRAFEVTDAEGRHVGLFYGDYFARPSKRSGAWMSGFRGQERLDEEVRPIIVNVMNFSKGAEGEPALLSFDDARTLFHEFGHALHGLLSDVTYPSLAGTAVPSDFVELPSQLFEHWFEVPEILRRFAVHYRTGEPMPEALLQRMLAARNFGQGFATSEYLGSAMFDLDIHLRPQGAEAIDLSNAETATRERMGMPAEIGMRHRPPHFTHVFAGDGYSAGYYSYLWSEVLDADAFRAFEETGDPFDPATAHRLRDFIYAAGNLRDPAEAYRAFRGRMPTVDALLEKRGLKEVA